MKVETQEFKQLFMDEYQNRSPDENYKKLKSHIITLLINMCPPKCHAIILAHLGIIRQSKECAIRSRDHTIKLNALTNTIYWDAYNTHKKNTLTSIRKSPGTYIHGILQDSLDNSNTKPFWKFVKVQKQDNVGVTPMKVDGYLHTDSKDRANILNEQFKSVFTKNNQTITPRFIGPRFPPIQHLTITVKGVEKLLSNIKVNKASGPDNIPCRILQELSTELDAMLTVIFQQSLSSGKPPTNWLKAEVAPIVKMEESP